LVLSSEVIEKVARETGFLKRQSKLRPLCFLKMLLFDHLQIDQPSLQQHSFSVYNAADIQITKQGIDKRFNKETDAFVQAIFEQYLKHQLGYTSISSGLSQFFTAIRIMDSTEFQLPAQMAKEFPGFDGDGTAACAQLQFEYDLLSGKINHLSIDKARTSDVHYANETNGSLKAGELVLRDLGYYTLQMYKAIEERNAYFVSRLKTQVIIYEQQNGTFKELTYQAIIERLQNGSDKYIDIEVYIGKEGKQPVRLIANLLESEAVNRRIKRKKIRKRKLNEEDELWTQFNLFVTNVSRQTAAAEDIYHLYKLRWQIELIFKSWKSILKIHLVRPMKIYRFKCYLKSKLIWIMINWDIVMSFSEHIQTNYNKIISLYKCFSILKVLAQQLSSLIFKPDVGKLKSWLAKLFASIEQHAVKENKKGRVSVKNILKT
jgi:hypothetical protein